MMKCAEDAGVSLQPRYLKEMKAHLLLVRKEHAAAKGEGTTEDKEADVPTWSCRRWVCRRVRRGLGGQPCRIRCCVGVA